MTLPDPSDQPRKPCDFPPCDNTCPPTWKWCGEKMCRAARAPALWHFGGTLMSYDEYSIMEYWTRYDRRHERLLNEFVQRSVGMMAKPRSWHQEVQARGRARRVQIIAKKQRVIQEAMDKALVAKPPTHPAGCLCEWCVAVTRAKMAQERKALASATAG